MKKVLLALLISCFTLPLTAQTSIGSLSDKVHTVIRAQQVSARELVVREALKKEVFSPLRSLTWDDFLKESNQLQHIWQQNRLREFQQTYDDMCQAFDDDCNRFMEITCQRYGEFCPDYTQESQNTKYIYLTDASDHDTQTIPLEVIHVLTVLQAANPHKRILLATEFARRTRQEQVPIWFAQNPSDKSFELVGGAYQRLLPACKYLGIDILGLDDYLAPVQSDTVDFSSSDLWHPVKMGDALISFSLDTPAALRILWQYYEDLYDYLRLMLDTATDVQEITKQPHWEQNPIHKKIVAEGRLLIHTTSFAIWGALTDFVARSNWGIEQRNAQWARYIQAVSPFYDIVVVYMGSAHASAGASFLAETLPEKINRPFVEFNFYTQEQLPPQIQKSYQEAEQIQRHENTNQNVFSKEGDNPVLNMFLQRPDVLMYVAEKAAQPLLVPTPAEARTEGISFTKDPNFGSFDIYLPDRSTKP